MAPQQLWKVWRSLRNGKHNPDCHFDPVSLQGSLAPRDWEAWQRQAAPAAVPVTNAATV